MSNKKLSAYQVSEMFYNLFFDVGNSIKLNDYLENSFFDISGYIDLNKNEYHILYHVINKYFTPVFDGTYRGLFEKALDDFVHPDDLDIYKSAFDPDKMLERLENAEHKHFLFIQHRFRLQDGTYRYVENALITGEEYGCPKGIVKFYVFDIQNIKSRELGLTADERISLLKGKDELTSLYTEITFYSRSEQFAKENGNVCMISIDIEHFKLFDEWYGKSSGDYLLSKIGSILLKYVHEKKGIAGYFGNDDFALCTIYDKQILSDLLNVIRQAIVDFGFSVGFMPAFGICFLKDAISIRDAFDKASLTADKAKEDLKERIAIYNPEIRKQEEREYEILLDFVKALSNDEITFYLQPQCRLSTGKIVGAEALARWVKKDGSIIPPLTFIPILEKYGFITDLDKHIWESVAAWLRRCLDEHIKVVPISINVSRIDIFTIDIVDHLRKLVEAYEIPPSLLEVEITESAYAETSVSMSEIVSKLREYGFTVLMDDFGSGYSSLNMLSTLDVDVIKLDALFLNMTESADYKKGMHILESIVNMTKTIALPIIIEGVENDKQVNYLEELGCRYVQGFKFYKPMPNEQFKALIQKEDMLDTRGFVCKTNDQFKLREFLDENIYSDAMLNSILGPVAIYTLKDDHVNIVRFNEQFYKTVGDEQFDDRLEDIQKFLPEEDVPVIYRLLHEAMEDRLNGSSGYLHFYKTDGTLTSYSMHFYYLGEQNGADSFYGSADNVTSLIDLQQQMSLIAKYSSSTIVFLKRRKDVWSFEVAVHGLNNITGLSKEQLEKELNDWSFLKRLNSRDEEKLKELLNTHLNKNIGFTYSIKLRNAENKIVHLSMRADPVSDQANNVQFILTYRLVGE